MRETRQSGSEGGGACGAPYPYPDFTVPATFSPVRNRSNLPERRSPDCPGSVGLARGADGTCSVPSRLLLPLSDEARRNKDVADTRRGRVAGYGSV